MPLAECGGDRLGGDRLASTASSLTSGRSNGEWLSASWTAGDDTGSWQKLFRWAPRRPSLIEPRGVVRREASPLGPLETVADPTPLPLPVAGGVMWSAEAEGGWSASGGKYDQLAGGKAVGRVGADSEWVRVHWGNPSALSLLPAPPVPPWGWLRWAELEVDIARGCECVRVFMLAGLTARSAGEWCEKAAARDMSVENGRASAVSACGDVGALTVTANEAGG